MTDPMKTASERLDELLMNYSPRQSTDEELFRRLSQFKCADCQEAIRRIEELREDNKRLSESATPAKDGDEAAAIATERKRCIGIIDDLMQLTLKMRYAIEIDRLDRANISGFLEACALIKHQVVNVESAP